MQMPLIEPDETRLFLGGVAPLESRSGCDDYDVPDEAAMRDIMIVRLDTLVDTLGSAGLIRPDLAIIEIWDDVSTS